MDDILRSISHALVYFDLKFPCDYFDGPIDDKSIMVQAMALCLTGDKPLYELMMTKVDDGLRQRFSQIHPFCYGCESVQKYELTTQTSYDQLWRPDFKKTCWNWIIVQFCKTCHVRVAYTMLPGGDDN